MPAGDVVKHKARKKTKKEAVTDDDDAMQMQEDAVPHGDCEHR